MHICSYGHCYSNRSLWHVTLNIEKRKLLPSSKMYFGRTPLNHQRVLPNHFPPDYDVNERADRTKLADLLSSEAPLRRSCGIILEECPANAKGGSNDDVFFSHFYVSFRLRIFSGNYSYRTNCSLILSAIGNIPEYFL